MSVLASDGSGTSPQICSITFPASDALSNARTSSASCGSAVCNWRSRVSRICVESVPASCRNAALICCCRGNGVAIFSMVAPIGGWFENWRSFTAAHVRCQVMRESARIPPREFRNFFKLAQNTFHIQNVFFLNVDSVAIQARRSKTTSARNLSRSSKTEGRTPPAGC